MRRWLRTLSNFVCVCGVALGGRADAVAVPGAGNEGVAHAEAGVVAVALRPALIWHFDFDHPDGARPELERDQGPSGILLSLVNGGEAMRVEDEAWRGSGRALQTGQINPAAEGNDDWKAGCYAPDGVAGLRRCAGAAGITLMGWFKITGPVPAVNSTTPRADDLYAGAGLAGVLTGDSDGHFCRALLEILRIDGQMRVVALGRRVDGGATQMGVWEESLAEVLPAGRWTHLAAVFDYAAGTIRVYRDGRPSPMRLHQAGNPWASGEEPGKDRTSETAPTGLKVGGSYPQNQRERNPFNGRMDDLMAFDRVLTAEEVKAQFDRFFEAGSAVAREADGG